jgi:large subunit ribosomal protein L4
MDIQVINKENKKVETLALPAEIFSIPWNPELVHQVVVAHLANKRNTVAHAKTRGEIAGGGRKPWKQKHTGRARHGSTRSPIWVGGGVTHGPRNDRDFSKKVNKKMKRAALYTALSKKLKDAQLIVVDNFDFGSAKTKEYASFFKHFFKKQISACMVVQKEKKNAFLGARNIQGISIIHAPSLNTYECMAHKFIFIEKDAIMSIKKIEA